MTIGVGFRCIDGVVLCADTQITWPANHKYEESKMYRHHVGRNNVIFTFAGNPELMKMFFGKFQDAATNLVQLKSISETQQLIETVLSLMDVLDPDPDGLYMLCGISTPSGETKLLKTDRKVVREIRQFDYVGVGDSSLLRYLAHLFSPAGRRMHTTQEALRTAVYFVLQAKKFIDGCGGRTNALILDGKGNCLICEQLTRQEADWEELESAFGGLASSFLNERDSAEDFDARTQSFTEAMKQHRLPARP